MINIIEIPTQPKNLSLEAILELFKAKGIDQRVVLCGIEAV